MRIALVILFILHGIAHVPGFMISWKLMQSAETPYKTTILNGLLNLGDTGIKLYGILWLVAAVAFVIAAILLYLHADNARAVAIGVAFFSLLMCVAGLPDAKIGLAVNVVILAFFLVERQFGLLN